MHGRKSIWVLIVFILSGALIGGLTGEFLSQYPYFTWMRFGSANGYKNLIAFSMDPLINTTVLRFGFNFAIGINMGSIIGMVLGILLYTRI